jgi:hypothetical protein
VDLVASECHLSAFNDHLADTNAVVALIHFFPDVWTRKKGNAVK